VIDRFYSPIMLLPVDLQSIFKSIATKYDIARWTQWLLRIDSSLKSSPSTSWLLLDRLRDIAGPGALGAVLHQAPLPRVGPTCHVPLPYRTELYTCWHQASRVCSVCLECHLTCGRPCYRRHGVSRQRRLLEGLAGDQRLEGLEAARNAEPQYQNARPE
jgi:hypothetical protein